jgi:DNA-binding Xre family transcriptional regulator
MAAKKQDKETEFTIKPVITKQELAILTERLVRSDNLSYVEAIIHICDDLDLDPEDIAKMVTGPLKDKVEIEAMRNNIIPKSNTASLYEDT